MTSSDTTLGTTTSPHSETTGRNHMTRHHPETTPLNGVLLIDKPTGMTSHDVVDVIRRLYKTKRVGHAGTLDPAASGLLVILLGKATRAAALFMDGVKTYNATVCLGATSDTGDADGTIVVATEPEFPTADELVKILAGFTGTIDQKIPAYAATRTNGERRYERARRGETVPEESREVTIHHLALVRYDPPDAEIRVECSKGTYIRSLAEAIGESTDCGAYLGALRRRRSGRCDLNQAHTLADLQTAAERGEALPEPQSFEIFLETTVIDIKPESLDAIRCGRPILSTDVNDLKGDAADGDTVLLRDAGEGIIAIATALSNSATWPTTTTAEPIVRYRRVLISTE
jgi:tRNA pseudouridine55 synthase